MDHFHNQAQHLSNVHSRSSYFELFGGVSIVVCENCGYNRSRKHPGAHQGYGELKEVLLMRHMAIYLL